MSHNLLDTVVKVKNRMVVWSRMVVSGSVVCTPGRGGVVDVRCSCHYPESRERIVLRITRLDKVTIQNSKYSFY